MKRLMWATTALVAATTGAHAGGIDRSGQGLGALFEKGRYVELSYGLVSPNVDGNDVAGFGGQPTGDVVGSYAHPGFSYKFDINDKLSVALNFDHPFGADLQYGTTSVALGGTYAKADAYALTGILRYKISDAFSVHGGLRLQQAEGKIGLRGFAYGPVNGYSVNLSSDWAPGYLVGVAFEKPEIALRVALTYNSKLTHDFDTIETVGGGAVVVGTTPTEVDLPQSVNLDFQTGVAKDTLVFGQIRWVDWTAFQIDPAFFTAATGGGLVDLEDTVTYTLGVGRRLNETWSGSFSVSYEPKGSDPLVSPLAPIDGRYGATVGVVYTKDNMKVTGGVNYSWLGDAQPETGDDPDIARANMTDNTLVGVGVKVGWSF